MATINDMINGTMLCPGVVPKMRYRSNVTVDVPRWIVSAIRNITDKYPFEELSVPGQTVNLITGQAQYPISYFCNVTEKITRFDSFVIQISNSTNVTLELKWRAIKTVKPLISISGQPMYYNIYSEQVQTPGSQQVFIAFNPNSTYPVTASYQRKHPFTGSTDDPIMLPDAWLEVVACAAAEIGAQENAMTDILQLMRVNLYGDPKDPGEPGLIKSLISSRAQFSNVNERQLTFISGER